jgi:hypothetical protein
LRRGLKWPKVIIMAKEGGLESPQERSAPPGEEELREMIALRVGRERVPRRVRLVTDTTDFFRVDYDDVLMLGGRPYLIRNYEREGRFGIDEQPKFWVRRAVDLRDGSAKVIKMVFHETFHTKVGDLSFECRRSPRKEATVLEIVRGHPNFMQGFWEYDSAGNVLRIIDHIKGRSFASEVPKLGEGHEDYFHNHFPRLLDDYVELVDAIRFLHGRGQKHGDIRRDHIIRDSATGKGRWIDFDFNYMHPYNMFGYDLSGLGNVLVFLAAGGDATVQELRERDPAAYGRLTADDLNIVFTNRVVNLRKVWPYVPKGLNRVLMHFSSGARAFYATTGELLSDLKETRDKLHQTV